MRVALNAPFSWQADVINLNDWIGQPTLPERQRNQLFMFSTYESPYSPFSSESLRPHFNLLWSYHRDSDVILGKKVYSSRRYHLH